MAHTVSVNSLLDYKLTEILTSGEAIDGKRKRLYVTATISGRSYTVEHGGEKVDETNTLVGAVNSYNRL